MNRVKSTLVISPTFTLTMAGYI